MILADFTIFGEAASKANSRRIVTFGSRPASIKSDKARSFARTAQAQIPAAARLDYHGDVSVTMTVWYRTRRPDLDESLILDILQTQMAGSGKTRYAVCPGVIRNDRQVKEKHVTWGLDKCNPRVEITVETLP